MSDNESDNESDAEYEMQVILRQRVILYLNR